MTVDELIGVLLEMTELDPTVGGHQVMDNGRGITGVTRGERVHTSPAGARVAVQPVVRLVRT
jgi:hypothetical protein